MTGDGARIRRHRASVPERDRDSPVGIDRTDARAEVHLHGRIGIGGRVHRGESLALDAPLAPARWVRDDPGTVGVNHESSSRRRGMVHDEREV